MKVSQIKIGATINLGEYSDIRPEVTVDLTAKDKPEEAQKLALEQISSIWGQTDNKQLENRSKIGGAPVLIDTVEREVMKCYLSGTEVMYDDASHTYVAKDGTPYLSGSKFAHQYGHEFSKAMIIPKSAKKLGVEESVVDEYWTSKADISTTFGTALHKALEHYGKYKALADSDVDKTGMTKGTGIHPTLLPIVEEFFKLYGHETAVYEPFIADAKNFRCGQVDRAVITGPKTVIIDDYKTNGDLFKLNTPKFLKAPYQNIENTPFGGYRLQFSFYRAIFLANGWTVEKMRLHHWNGKLGQWDTYEVKEVEIDGVKSDRIDISQVV